ncbi:MAG: twin-arginine translocase subunit TatC [Deltaproteobacteria bacterium]|nr:MAG: twin-arginine translocase subunit TatC [Deltaproteobacteria bacterium]
MDDTPRPLIDHLHELRRRLFWILGTWAIFAGIAGYWVKDVFELLMGPAIGPVRAHGHKLIVIAPPELFFTYVKSALLAGFVVSIPMTLYQIWTFVSPGLYKNERRFAMPFVLATSMLFFSGCAFGYFVAFPNVFEYFLSLEADYVTTSWTTNTLFSFMSRLYLAFGISFQLPVVMFFLALAGITRPEALARGRKYAVVVMFAASAVLTPPDIVSQVMLALPLCVLYESGIWISRVVVRRQSESATPSAAE